MQSITLGSDGTKYCVFRIVWGRDNSGLFGRHDWARYLSKNRSSSAFVGMPTRAPVTVVQSAPVALA